VKVSLHTAQASQTPLWWDALRQHYLPQLHDTHLEPPCGLFLALEGAPAKALARRHLLSLLRVVCQVLSWRDTSRKSAPFRVGYLHLSVALSARLQGGLRFFRHPLPAAPSPFLAVGIPLLYWVWSTSGLPSWLSWRCVPVRLGSLSRWGLWVLLPAAIYRQSAPRCHFGYGLSASLAASDWRDVQPFTYVQPSGASL